MPRYLDVAIDPESVHIHADVPFLEHLEQLVQQATAAAVYENKVVVIHHDNDPALDETGGTRDVLAYRDWDAEFFALKTDQYQCPRAADLRWQEVERRPRPWPSMMVSPNPVVPEGLPEVVVANKSLCETCVHRLQRAVSGDCVGLRYQKLGGLVS